MNLIPLPLLPSSLQGVIRSSWLFLLTFIVVQTGFAQQNPITEIQLLNPLQQSEPSNPYLVPTSAPTDGTIGVLNNISDYYYTFTYTSLPSACCSESITIKAAKNSFQSGNNWWEIGVSYTGTFNRNIGPSMSELLYCTVYWSGKDNVICLFNDCSTNTNAPGTLTGSTAALFSPTGVTASDGTYDTQITLNWDHGTHLPHADHSYRIYRDNTLIATVSGTTTNYTDTGLSPGQSFTYGVATYTTSYGTHESVKSTNVGSTFNVGLEASDGGFYNRTKLSWNNIAAVCDEVRIERSIPGTANKEEIAILSDNATAYNDQDGIPGYPYTYYVTPIVTNGSFLTDTDTGYSKPNGKISGHVRSQLNAGVSGVDISVRLLSNIPAGGAALPVCPLEYCATTDAEGYYEISNIYYDTSADFRIIPDKPGMVIHDFSPDSITRTLDVNAKTAIGVDFTDLTVFTVGGRVTYPTSSNGSTCGIKGVSILVDGKDYGITTNANGNWTFAVQQEDTLTFQAKYLHHTFAGIGGDSIPSLFINGDNTNIDFEDQETDSLMIIAQAGCGASLGNSVTILVTAPNNCFSQSYMTDANGLLTIHGLPARNYSVQVTDVDPFDTTNYSNIIMQIANKPVIIDLTVRDTAQFVTETETEIITPASIDTLPNNVIIVTPADTVLTTLVDTTYGAIPPQVSFIYRSPLDIHIDFEDAGADVVEGCPNSAGDDIILMEQGIGYDLQIEVKETFGEDCFIDTGFLKIYDFVSDRGGTPVKIPIHGGIASYHVDAGEPDVAENLLFHNHEKLLYIIPEVDLLDPEPVEYWVFVTGAKSNTPSFITRTPEIPMIILHDPPGDNSYSFIEKGTSFTSFTETEVLVGGEAGGYLNLLLGAKFLTPFSGQGFGTQIKFQATAGRDNFDRDGIFTTVTFNERFSTSQLENLTGNDGDVYIGAAFNQEFSIAQLLTWDMDSCKGDIRIVPSLAVEDFATTFVYTEKHVKNTLLPTLSFLKNSILNGQPFSSLDTADQFQVNSLIADSVSWANILHKNDIARDSAATFKENISFSAGAPLSREYSSENMVTHSYEYNIMVNSEFALGAKIDNEAGIWFDSELGVMGKFRFSTSVNEGHDTTMTQTTGYVFDDNDIGDFFSVDIKTDNSYNVPAFKLKLGTTSCPQEPGSQARDRCSINIIPPEQTNIPAGEAANFICQITNLSESFETREYGVRVVPTTNPDGMIVTLAGQWIGSGEGTFFLTPNQTANLVLSFDQGPLASTYNNIGVMVYPTCEYPLWQDNGNLTNSDTAWVKRIEWQTLCTDVSLHLPDDGWLVNQQSNNILHAAFTGYDVNNSLFDSLILQLKKEGEGYADQIIVPKSSLTGAFYDVYLDVSNFPDGDYRLRAMAYCGIDGGITYSSEKLGTIDRSSIAPFGTPTPSDGFLREGQEVSVTFDKTIDCGLPGSDITLIRDDNQQPIPFTTSCFGNKLIINTTPPLIDQPSLDGVLVKAHVAQLQDLVGNVQEYPTDWSFLVNVSPVFWDPEEFYASGYEKLQNTFKTTLKNTSLLSKPYSLATEDSPIIEYPEWLTPAVTRGTILSENENEVTFIVDPDLKPGIYSGPVVAMVDSLPVTMNVTYEQLATPVSWAFNPDAYQYSMTVVAQFSLNSENVDLSTDTRDLVGAFVNGQIRGITHMVYIPQLNVYRAFLTVYSNNAGGGGAETVTFRYWRALTGVEYSAVESTIFTLDNTVGTVPAPFILHPQGFLQVIPLSKGWNWISLNVSNPNMTKEFIFQSILNTPVANVVTIKSKTQTASYSPQSGWSGALANLQLGAGYLVELSNGPDTLRITGLPSASTVLVPVVGNWNWIGFPRLTPEPVNTVLSNLTNAVTGDILKSQTQFSIYHTPSVLWLGNLNFFNPGEGYKFKLTNPGTIIFSPSRSDGFELDPYLYEYNMNVNGMA
ncbi:MAG TPA: fibronectin type III domain-containing protein, partial [Saprospiraceae bacterium]|nr:fibronectin type III domain-containing protein [Saprospiraceae bacterium]